MKKYSIELFFNKLSNDTIALNQKSFEDYLKNINQFQNKKITYSENSKSYTHIKNNDLLVEIIHYFENIQKDMIIFNKEDNIQSISQFELLLLKSNKNIKIRGFENNEALLFLKENHLIPLFLDNELEVNIMHYYSEYSKSFGERVNIKNQKELICDLSKIQEYLKNSILLDEYKIQSVYSSQRKSKVISLSHGKKHTVLDNGNFWLEDLIKKNKEKESGFPFAKGEVVEESVKKLLKEIT